jgi:hypothetical protein
MKVSFIQISRDPFSKDYKVSFHDLNGERKVYASTLKPCTGLQCYYYDTEIGVENAFEELRSAMIQRAEEEIAMIQRDIENLRKLKVYNS